MRGGWGGVLVGGFGKLFVPLEKSWLRPCYQKTSKTKYPDIYFEMFDVIAAIIPGIIEELTGVNCDLCD